MNNEENKKLDQILTLVSELKIRADKTDQDLVEMKVNIKNLTETVGGLTETVGSLVENVDYIKDHAVTKEELAEELAPIKATMVTKEYLSEKLAEHSDEPIKFIKGTDDKVKTVVQKLKDKNIFSSNDQNDILRMKPFAGTI